ncbi:hypothetical protein PVK06_041826 [Gossypium arboreum]|uniref:Uncharacterized protein n=1 Tax=Gossypium arboreum TaxID=29729 RepID=A0ABR0N9B9_GOSAR|nr:hypothetical protein PVK06_041826 [Gossypium arboreum]
MDTLYNNMKVEMDDLKKCYDPKESEKYSTETRNWLGSSSLTVAQFYKQFIHVVLMNAIIRFIDDTVITPAEDRFSNKARTKRCHSHTIGNVKELKKAELTKFDNDFTVTSYMCFLDLLIDEAEDVKDLRAAGILYNGLGSDEKVAKIFNKMNTDLVPSSKIYSEVKRIIHNHCKTTWINHAAQGYHTYFRSPWTFLALVGAITALLLGALQTYYAIHQPK